MLISYFIVPSLPIRVFHLKKVTHFMPQVITKEVTESLHRFLSQVYVSMGRTMGKTVRLDPSTMINDCLSKGALLYFGKF